MVGYDTTGSNDNNGAMLSQKITVPTEGANTGFVANQTYTYDSLNRIQSATETVSSTQTWKQTFQYDRYDNRRFDTSGTNTTTLCTSFVTNAVNPTISTSNNRVSTGQGYTYDANGNLTQDTNNSTVPNYVYDTESRQIAVQDASNVDKGNYQYDGEGRRVKKIDSDTTVFVYDGAGQLAAEYSTTLSTTPQVSYPTNDHLGSPRVVTNQTGAITSRKDFDAYGQESFTSQRTTGLHYLPTTTPREVRQDYTGYQKDEESGLEYAQARYYNPAHGRFTSVDPLTASATTKDPQTFNRYIYSLNSPYKFTDPLGLSAEGSSWSCSNCGASFNGDGGAFSSAASGFNQDESDDGLFVTLTDIYVPPQTNPEPLTPPKPMPRWVSATRTDLSKDEVINSGIAKIQADATPLKEGETPVLTNVKPIVGKTYKINFGIVVDVYGSESEFLNDFVVTPVAYVPLDQGGNIIKNGGLVIREKLKLIYGEPPSYDPKHNTDAPKGGVFFDIQSTFQNSPKTEITQNVGVGKPGGVLFQTGINTIIKDGKAGTISVQLGTTKRIQ